MTGREKLRRWNSVCAQVAVTELLPCNGSYAWASGMINRRPFKTVDELLAAADTVWVGLPQSGWQEAFDSHPRIGERHAKSATEAGLRWSASEQRGVSGDQTTQAALIEANGRYEERFGRVFLVCATGKSALEILAILETRLRNEPAVELLETAEQQRRITQLRLRKWLGLPAAHCEDV